MKNKRFILIAVIWIASFGCQNSVKNYPVDFIDRHAVLLDEKPNPLLLVVEITENGRLSLNKIETGTISDLAVLNGKLQIIFDDREKAGISEKGVIIDPQVNVKDEDLEKLIESLAAVKSAPIRVIKNNFSKK